MVPRVLNFTEIGVELGNPGLARCAFSANFHVATIISILSKKREKHSAI